MGPHKIYAAEDPKPSRSGPDANEKASKHSSSDEDTPSGTPVRLEGRDELPITPEIESVPVEYMPLMV